MLDSTVRVSMKESVQRVLLPPGKARGLPSQTYTNAEWFEFERTHVLGDSWAAIGFSNDVPGPGYAVPIEFMQLPLLMTRNKHGDLRVYHNVCSHRGMRLVHEASQLRTVIRCPYHSWSYDLDGQLIATPLVGGVDKNDCDGFERHEHGLKTVQHATWMGIVFVNLSATAAPFSKFIARLDTRWQAFLGKEGTPPNLGPAGDFSHVDLSVNCNWKLAVENYCEAYHLPWVHPELNSYSPLAEHYNIVDGDDFSGQGTALYNLAETSGTKLPQFDTWPAEKRRHAEYISLYPNVLLGLQVDHFFAVIVLPKSPNQSLERLQISYLDEAVDDNNFARCRETVRDSWKKVFAEDVFAVEGMQNGRQSPAFDGGVLTPVQDIPTQHFHSWVARHYQANL